MNKNFFNFLQKLEIVRPWLLRYVQWCSIIKKYYDFTVNQVQKLWIRANIPGKQHHVIEAWYQFERGDYNKLNSPLLSKYSRNHVQWLFSELRGCGHVDVRIVGPNNCKHPQNEQIWTPVEVVVNPPKMRVI